jgi:hypothetical protein
MRGADGVRDQLALLFATELPRKIPLLRRQRGWGAEILPDVSRIVSGIVPDETIRGSEATPTWVVVVNPRLLRMTPTGDYSPEGEAEFHSLYACRVLVWHLGKDWDLSIAGRDHLAEACRLCLVQYPTLSVDPGDSGFRLNVPTYTEDFGSPSRTLSGKAWAAAILGVDVIVQEHLDDGSTQPPLGTVGTVEPDSYAAGFAEPMRNEG